MKTTKRVFLSGGLAGAIALTLLTGCDKKDDAISNAERADKNAAIAAPGIAETKAIAEEGFIYGLPIVMNYAVMNEFVIDKNSGQYKAPFNQINNEARVFTYKDTAVVTPNSDTPYSMLWLDLRAEPMVISVPAVEKERYYSVQLIDGNAYNYGYIGSRATGDRGGRLSRGRPRLERRDARGDQESLPLDNALRAYHLPHPTFQRRRHAQRRKGAGGLQSAAAFRLPQATRTARRAEDRFRPGQSPRASRTNFYEYLDAALEVRPRDRRGHERSAPGSRASASGRASRLPSKTSRPNTRPPSCSR